MGTAAAHALPSVCGLKAKSTKVLATPSASTWPATVRAEGSPRTTRLQSRDMFGLSAQTFLASGTKHSSALHCCPRGITRSSRLRG